MRAIRPAAVAGSFYPAAAAELQSEIGKLLGSTDTAAIAPLPKALIVPHASYIYSGPTAATAYGRLVPARGRITRVVLLGPSHFVGFRGLAAGTAAAWQTPLGTVPIDLPVLDRLIKTRLIGVLDAAHAREHSLEVQIPFLQVALGEFALVPIVAGDASPEAIAALLDMVWSGPESACGRVPVRGLLVIAKRRGMSIARLDLRNSGDTAGPRDGVVGYGSWALFEPADQQRAEGLGRLL